MSERGEPTPAALAVSLSLQDVAQQIEEMLSSAARKPVGFVLVAHVDNCLLHVGNSCRAYSSQIVSEVLANWKAEGVGHTEGGA